MAGTEKNTTVSDERAMQEMMALLEEWQIPEPSPWFDARMMARFREEQARPPEGIFARLRDRFLFGNPIGYKPMLAGTMALVLMAGGGGYLELLHMEKAHPAKTSATVQDLQILDNNDQAIQQMDQLLDSNDDGTDTQS